jgi:hypothetical protein
MDWWERPIRTLLLIVGAGAIPGFALGWLVYKELRAPIEAQDLKDQVTDSNRRTANVATQLKAANAKEREQNAEIAKLEEENHRLRFDGLFTRSDVYPLGFRDVRIGDDARKVVVTYGQAKADGIQGTQWVGVDVHDSYFRSAAYYTLNCGEKERISRIRFSLTNEADAAMLEQKARETFGEAAVNAERSEIDHSRIVWIDPINGAGAVIQRANLDIVPTKKLRCDSK